MKRSTTVVVSFVLAILLGTGLILASPSRASSDGAPSRTGEDASDPAEFQEQPAMPDLPKFSDEEAQELGARLERRSLGGMLGRLSPEDRAEFKRLFAERAKNPDYLRGTSIELVGGPNGTLRLIGAVDSEGRVVSGPNASD